MNNRKLIKDTEFLVIDFETITPKGRSPEPIEVGVLRISNNQIDEKASVNWEKPRLIRTSTLKVAKWRKKWNFWKRV